MLLRISIGHSGHERRITAMRLSCNVPAEGFILAETVDGRKLVFRARDLTDVDVVEDFPHVAEQDIRSRR